MDPRLGTALLVVVGIPAVIVGYIYATESSCGSCRNGGEGRSVRGCGCCPPCCS